MNTLRFFILLLSFSIQACLEKSLPEYEERSFTKIYDHADFAAQFKPIDIAETDDGGFIILAERNLTGTQFSGIFLMKADRKGNFIRTLSLPDNLVNAIPRLIPADNQYYFLAMDAFTVEAILVQIDANLEHSQTTNLSGITYPAAASADADRILLLSYNSVSLQSVFSVVRTTGQVIASRAFSIGPGDGSEEPIMGHFLRTGKRFPFFTGRTGNLYYFNGFYNYTFSLVFTDLIQEAPVGVVQGQQDDGGLQVLQHLSGNVFAVARFNFGDHYLLPRVNLSLNGISSATDLGGFIFPEIPSQAKVDLIRASMRNQQVLIYGSDTRSGQVGLYVYDEANGNLLTRMYIGSGNPFEISVLRQTREGDLVVCGTTYVAGRFARIFLTKIPAEKLSW
jgi:hypothetical protein